MIAKLNTGAHIPVLGFGTASKDASYEEVKVAVLGALEAGYRHFDTATLYKSEEPLGEALSEAFEAGLVTREEVFVTSKLWVSDNYPDGVIPAIQKTLSALRLAYLDLYLMHWPFRTKEEARTHPWKDEDYLPIDTKGTWQAMEKCVEQGLTKAIGVCHFSCKKVEDLLTYATIPPAVNQVEMHPRWQQKQLRGCCSKAKIHVSACSPLGAPGLPWGCDELLTDSTIKDIALNYGKTPAQVILRWGIEQGVSVLPKSYTKDHQVENSQIFDWELTQEDHEKISTIDQKKNIRAQELCNDTTSPYKTLEELWDGEI